LWEQLPGNPYERGEGFTDTEYLTNTNNSRGKQATVNGTSTKALLGLAFVGFISLGRLGASESVEESVTPKPTLEQRAQAIHEVYEKRHKLEQRLIKPCGELWNDEWLACKQEENTIKQQIAKEVPLPALP
jgi:hypothetical protein